ncbi:hypothetical protein RhiXN_04920 [Rhizoctonia solani]|uniref:Uncharacterized protein n=1 Tax=Rhizoctonia solani TaxID=456999 RepID=A0A8H8SUB0_9AGAM|nr:uncharacterized protein RhiXN_04920 [Rhizoctonia solani]QRW16918.1 hypothetical protein RhiXN_04920 [Rhizoctonia solani]
MATCSWPPSRSQTKIHLGDMEPQLLAAPAVDKNGVREATLEWVICLLWGSKDNWTALNKNLASKPKPSWRPAQLSRASPKLLIALRLGLPSPSAKYPGGPESSPYGQGNPLTLTQNQAYARG